MEEAPDFSTFRAQYLRLPQSIFCSKKRARPSAAPWPSMFWLLPRPVMDFYFFPSDCLYSPYAVATLG